MNTYNFEQAIEGLAHGIPVRRIPWAKDLNLFLDPSGNVQIRTNQVFIARYSLSLSDFYATDWVDAS